MWTQCKLIYVGIQNAHIKGTYAKQRGGKRLSKAVKYT